MINLPPEIEEGNIEYKRHVATSLVENPVKITKFKTQLLWRLGEGKQCSGKSEAVYYIGIEDDGTLSNLNIIELNESIKNFTKIVKLAEANILSTQITHIDEYVFAKIDIYKLDNCLIINELTVGLLGGSNTGKSSFLGVLTFDIHDDGLGLARSNILRHDHEKQNGMTSSIKHEIIGYDDNGYINYNSNFIYSWEYIVTKSKSIINFIDLPGNSKYIKTTLFGLMAHKPSHVLIFSSLVDDNNTIDAHVELCTKLKIPFTIIWTKKDLVKYQKKDDDTIMISNVTGEGIEDVKKLLKNIKKKDDQLSVSETVEFVINDTIIVPDIGTVLTGILIQGEIKIGDTLQIGPYNNTFYSASIMSIHKKQIPSKCLYCGEIGTVVIHTQSNKINISKYMMLVTQDQLVHFNKNFKIIIHDKNNITINSKYMAFCRNIYDTVVINEINNNILSVSFSGIQYIKEGEFIILKNNNELVVGEILN